MQISISGVTNYLNEPCERCGSKRRMGKSWEENIESIFTGKKTKIEYSQIVCVNISCQTAFNAKLLDETKKREELQAQKSKNDIERKENSLKMAKKAKKTK